MAELVRCAWTGEDDELMLAYHDEEWGAPLHGDRALFELLTLEGAQAGLSWRTVLHRREGYRRVFEGFDIAKVAGWTEADQARALQDEGIIRNRAKVAATVGNAGAALEMIAAGGEGVTASHLRINRSDRVAASNQRQKTNLLGRVVAEDAGELRRDRRGAVLLHTA